MKGGYARPPWAWCRQREWRELEARSHRLRVAHHGKQLLVQPEDLVKLNSRRQSELSGNEGVSGTDPCDSQK